MDSGSGQESWKRLLGGFLTAFPKMGTRRASRDVTYILVTSPLTPLHHVGGRGWITSSKHYAPGVGEPPTPPLGARQGPRGLPHAPSTPGPGGGCHHKRMYRARIPRAAASTGGRKSVRKVRQGAVVKPRDPVEEISRGRQDLARPTRRRINKKNGKYQFCGCGPPSTRHRGAMAAMAAAAGRAGAGMVGAHTRHPRRTPGTRPPRPLPATHPSASPNTTPRPLSAARAPAADANATPRARARARRAAFCEGGMHFREGGRGAPERREF